MKKTIPQLKSIWNREKGSYKTQEVGSGVQRFVRNTMECADIFNLNEGKLSTSSEKRRNEFICEKKTKDRRQADFVIYVNPDIIIPVEVEQYGKIERGVTQLSQYQSDLDKKYGILTDGYSWRFYNNNIYRVFTLDHILSQTGYFLEFWKEYVKPEFYYLSFFEKAGQLSFLGEEELQIEEDRELFFIDITTLIRSFRNKLRIEGYFNGLAREEAEKKATEIAYAYIIQFILYKTLVDNRFDVFDADYKNRIAAIRTAIKKRSYTDILGRIDGMSELISKNIYRPFVKEQEQIRGKMLELFHKAKNELSDVSPWLDIVVFIKKYNFQGVRNEIFGYVYENYLKELYKAQKRGQYFTDPYVVNFMLEQVGYTAKEITSKIKANQLDKLSIVDPACGSGTFLYSATDEIIKSHKAITDDTSKQVEEIVTNNVFGLDIEEFPLYLAEMNILMRMLPLVMGEKYNNPLDKKIKVFLTKDSLAEFIGSGLSSAREQTSFLHKIIKPKFESFVRSERDLTEMKGSMTSFPRRRFDYVIANPPYISYNECCKQGILVFDLIKSKQIQLNDIFGVNLHSIPGSAKKYAPKPNLYAFFIALGLALLKDDGRLCYIVPQTVLTAGDLDVLRYHLAKYATIEKIITFNSNLFIDRGLKQKRIIPTSSLILVVGKNAPSKTHEVQVINYKRVEDTINDTLNNIVTGKKTDVRKVKQADLLENATNWNFIKQTSEFVDFHQVYQKNTDSISAYWDHQIAQRLFKDRFYFDKGLVFEKDKITERDTKEDFYNLVKLDHLKISATKLNSKIKRSDIRIPHGSQGLDLFDKKYKIVWRYMNYDKFHFSDDKIMISFNYVIISSNNRNGIVYLMALLNSRVTSAILNGSLRSEAEKDILLGIKAIKEYIRVPRITPRNKHIKEQITKRTEELLALEEKTLSDFVDFSHVLLQKFDHIQVGRNKLVLVHDNQKTELRIKGDSELIAGTIAKEFGAKALKLEKRKIPLSKLRNLQVVDLAKQAELKDYIDDLVFSLYFNIALKGVGLEVSTLIRKACSKSRYYRFL